MSNEVSSSGFSVNEIEKMMVKNQSHGESSDSVVLTNKKYLQRQNELSEQNQNKF